MREKRLTQVDHALCYLTETTAKLFARQPRSCRPTDTHAQRRGKKKKKVKNQIYIMGTAVIFNSNNVIQKYKNKPYTEQASSRCVALSVN